MDLTSQTQIENTIVNSVFDYLPDNFVTSFLVKLNAAMTNSLVQHVPDNSLTHFFVSNPLLFLIIFFVFAVSIAIFLDFIQDAWKMPFAIIVDIIDLMALSHPGVLNFVAAAGSLIIFYLFATKPSWARYTFGGIGAVKCLMPVRIAGIIPANTIMMFVATIID